MNTHRYFVQSEQLTLAKNHLCGHLVPHRWYSFFTNLRGSPDQATISVLSEIVYWYRPKKIQDTKAGKVAYINKFKDDAWQTSYSHLSQKFHLSHERIRKALVKLENLGIIKRELRSVVVRGQVYSNRLFIHFYPDALTSHLHHNKHTSTGNSNSQNFPKLEKKSDGLEALSSSGFLRSSKEDPSPCFEGELYKDKEIKYKNRSIESVFNKTNSESNYLERKGNVSDQLFVSNKTKKPLSDFYPLSQQDCYSLQKLSGREFSLNAMNEILLNMSKRLDNKGFWTKKCFLKYMTAVFKNEMRDTEKTNNESFKIRSNMTASEQQELVEEKYLSSIENDQDTSTDMILKKKLANVLSRRKAYLLIQQIRHLKFRGEVCELVLSKSLELSESDKKIILNQIKSLHTDKIDFVKLEIVELSSDKKSRSLQSTSSKVLPDIQKKPLGIWSRIRQNLLERYGSEVDKAWFSKLESSEDKISKKIRLSASSGLARDWIKNNYEISIEQAIWQHGFILEGIYAT